MPRWDDPDMGWHAKRIRALAQSKSAISGFLTGYSTDQPTAPKLGSKMDAILAAHDEAFYATFPDARPSQTCITLCNTYL
jgi:hypothetical protein